MISLFGHKETENKFEDFRKKYDEFMKWTVKQFEMISKLFTCEEEAVKERDELRRYLSHIDTKMDGLENMIIKLDKKTK